MELTTISEFLESQFGHFEAMGTHEQGARVDKLRKNNGAISALNALAQAAEKSEQPPELLLMMLLNDCVAGEFEESSKLSGTEIKNNCTDAAKAAIKLARLIEQTEPLRRTSMRLLEPDEDRKTRMAVANFISPFAPEKDGAMEAYRWVQYEANDLPIAELLRRFAEKAQQCDTSPRHPKPKSQNAERNSLIGALCGHCDYFLGRPCYQEVARLIGAIYGECAKETVEDVWKDSPQHKEKNRDEAPEPEELRPASATPRIRIARTTKKTE